MEDAARVDGSPDGATVDVARAYATGGFPMVRRRQLEAMASSDLPQAADEGKAQIYAELGDREHALHLLEQALPKREPALIYLGADPSFDSLRGDPRFEAIKRQIGLPR